MDDKKTDIGSIEKLKKQVEDDLALDRTNVLEEAQNNCVKYHRYLTLLYTEKANLSKLEDLRIKLNGKLYHYYKFEYDHKLASGTEISIYINKNDKMIIINNNITIMKEKIKYIEGIIECFKQRSFMIRNLIDVIKLEKEGFY
jgi:hypothetical protein